MISTGSNMAIGISVFLRDRFTQNAARVSRSMRGMNDEARKLHAEQLRAYRNVNAAGATVGGLALLQMGKWVKQGAEYGYTMKYVGQLADGSKKQLDALDARAKQLGQTTMFSATDIASGMRYMAMAGMNASEIMSNVTAATNMSIATMTELGGKGGGADIMTNVMRAFNIEGSQAARVADVLTYATTKANTNLFDLGEAMKYSASTAKDLGVGLEETSVMAMMAGNAGIQGSMAGTAVENMLRYITQATSGDSKKRNSALSMLGMKTGDLKDAKGNLKPIGDILSTIAKATEKMSMGNADMQNVYQVLFGVRGKREASLLLRNMGEYHRFLSMINNESKGSADRIAAGQMDTAKGRMVQLADTWENFKIAFSEAMQPVVIPLLRGITEILKLTNELMSTGFGKFLTILGVGWIAMKTAAMAYKAIVASIRLYHINIGSSITSAASKTVAGYNSMTAAATRYAAASGMGMGGAAMTMMGSGMGRRTKNGQFVNTATASRYQSRFGKWGQAKTMGRGIMGKGLGMLGSIPKLFGGGMGLGLAGMGLDWLGQKVGGTAGSYMGVGGDALSGAGMGAMIGSVIPGLGTAIGALTGGLIGLGTGIYSLVNSQKENTEALKENTKTSEEEAKGGGFWERRLKVIDENSIAIEKFNMLMSKQMNLMQIQPDPWRIPMAQGEAYEQPKFLNIYLDGKQAAHKAIKDWNKNLYYEQGL